MTMRHDICGGSDSPVIYRTRLKDGFAAVLCDDSCMYNETPVQSQPHRDMGSRNEGGSVRTTEGFDSREADKAGRRLYGSRLRECDKYKQCTGYTHPDLIHFTGG